MPSILVIEDNEDIRALYKRILERAGHKVIEAPDGKAGTRLYRESPADLVITDIIMPEKEGIETIKELTSDFPYKDHCHIGWRISHGQLGMPESGREARRQKDS